MVGSKQSCGRRRGGRASKIISYATPNYLNVGSQLESTSANIVHRAGFRLGRWDGMVRPEFVLSVLLSCQTTSKSPCADPKQNPCSGSWYGYDLRSLCWTVSSLSAENPQVLYIDRPLFFTFRSGNTAISRKPSSRPQTKTVSKPWSSASHRSNLKPSSCPQGRTLTSSVRPTQSSPFPKQAPGSLKIRLFLPVFSRRFRLRSLPPTPRSTLRDSLRMGAQSRRWGMRGGQQFYALSHPPFPFDLKLNAR